MKIGGSQGELEMHLMMSNVNSDRSTEKFRLHPLIHTLLEFNLLLDMVSCQCGEKENPPPTQTIQGRPMGKGLRHRRATAGS
jgi:hypothetical protein